MTPTEQALRKSHQFWLLDVIHPRAQQALDRLAAKRDGLTYLGYGADRVTFKLNGTQLVVKALLSGKEDANHVEFRTYRKRDPSLPVSPCRVIEADLLLMREVLPLEGEREGNAYAVAPHIVTDDWTQVGLNHANRWVVYDAGREDGNCSDEETTSSCHCNECHPSEES